MVTIDKALELLQAYKEDKTLEYLEPYDTHHWQPILNITDLLKYLSTEDYIVRIKPEPKFRPYNSAEELLKASKMHGPYIKTATGSFLPTYIISQGIIDCRDYTILYSEILKDYTWQDGTPCGILE